MSTGILRKFDRSLGKAEIGRRLLHRDHHCGCKGYVGRQAHRKDGQRVVRGRSLGDGQLSWLPGLLAERANLNRLIATSQANFVAQGNPTCDHYRDFCLGTMSAKQQSEAICMGPMTDLLAC